MAEDHVRRDLLIKTVLEILRDAGTKIPPSQVLDELRGRLELTSYELSVDNSGMQRYNRAVGFHTLEAATIGWMSKIGGWSITDAGIEALEAYPDASDLWTELQRLYREVDQRRRQALQNLSEVHQFIATTLQMVDPGLWTAHDDLAVLADTTASEVAYFLANASVRLPSSYRVLNADGSIPDEGILNAAYRGMDLQRRLIGEGIEFNADGCASQAQRLTADALRELLEAREAEDEAPASAKRAWMVRGSNVDGYNLVPDWLRDGFVSLSASQLGQVDPATGYDELKQAVETGYQHKSYAYRAQRLEEFDRFLRRMRTSDLVLTPLHGGVFLGEVTGPAYFAESAAPHSNLRRNVRWLHPDNPVDGNQLRAPVPALLQSQAYIVDLTEAYDQLAALTPREVPPEPPVPVPAPVRRELSFNAITPEFAKDLELDQAKLTKIAGLLWEKKQIIFYGPPGTGKTYLATKLARHLTEDGAVKLVQFHPSYTYEDFFEGFRPEPGGSGALTFTLRAGPFRDFAEVAVFPAGIPRPVNQPPVLTRHRVRTPGEPVPHRHDEHRRPLDRPDRQRDAPPIRVRRTRPTHPAGPGPAQPLAGRPRPSDGRGAAARRAKPAHRRLRRSDRPLIPDGRADLPAPGGAGTRVAVPDHAAA